MLTDLSYLLYMLHIHLISFYFVWIIPSLITSLKNKMNKFIMLLVWWCALVVVLGFWFCSQMVCVIHKELLCLWIQQLNSNRNIHILEPTTEHVKTSWDNSVDLTNSLPELIHVSDKHELAKMTHWQASPTPANTSAAFHSYIAWSFTAAMIFVAVSFSYGKCLSCSLCMDI